MMKIPARAAAFCRTALVLGLGLGVTACASLPAQGPLARDVEAQARPVGNGANARPRYMLVDLNPSVVSTLEREPAPTFYGRFGDHRSAPLQQIGTGDALVITIWEAAAGGLFTSPVLGNGSTGSHSVVIPEQLVQADGSITVPYAGRIQAAGRTGPSVERDIIARLAGKAIEPQALVTVARNLSNTVTVNGDNGQGARIPLSPRGDKLLDIIASAGGPRQNIADTFVSLTRTGTTATVPMQTLLYRPQENIYVRPGDVVTLIRDPQSFTAFGATGRNAMIPFDARGITLQEAIAKTGGLNDGQSDPRGVFLLRPEPVEIAHQIDPAYPIPPGARAVNVVYRINLQDTNTYFLARDFPIRNKDIVYVSDAPVTEVQKFFGVISTITGPIGTAAAVASVAQN